MPNYIFEFKQPVLIKIKMMFDFRQEYEEEYITMVDNLIKNPNKDGRDMKYLWYPIHIDAFGNASHSKAMYIAIYDNYQYILSPVTPEEAEKWYKRMIEMCAELKNSIPDVSNLVLYDGPKNLIFKANKK